MTDGKDNSFQAALAQVLRPLARAMVGQSVTIAQATELLKQAYVSSVLHSETDSPTDSRISVLTGIHRKDVKRLRESDPKPPRRPMLNASALAVAVWSTDPTFLGDDGGPLPLARTGPGGFDALVKRARIDLPASTLLEALKEQGLVVQASSGDPISLVYDDLAGVKDLSAKIMAFEKNMTAHLDAVADNLGSAEHEHFERAAHFNQLSEASIATLEAEARARLQEVLLELNDMALKLQDQDAADHHRGRFSVGGYVLGQPSKEGGPDET